jgi:hypothetical protein
MHTYSTLGLLNAAGDGFWTMADLAIIRQIAFTRAIGRIQGFLNPGGIMLG